MISIIIPIYNAEPWLDECLGSIARQSYEDFEVLMVDDGSKDGSASICKKYAENDVRFKYIFQENAGVSVARNTALSHAQGEWISFVDADDKVDVNFLKTMLSQTEGADLVACDYATDDLSIGREGECCEISKEKFLRNIILEKGKSPQLWSLLYRHEIITQHGLCFTPGCIRAEDYEFYMKYITYCQKPISLLGYVGYFYRLNPDSVMRQRRSRTSVIMSLEASNRVSEEVERVGVIPDKTWLTAFSVITFLYIMSREHNKEVYDELHDSHPVKSYARISLFHGGIRHRGAAFVYLLLGRKLFYKAISGIFSLLRPQLYDKKIV